MQVPVRVSPSRAMSSSVRCVLWTPVVRGPRTPWSARSRVGGAAVGGEAGVVLGGLLGEVDVQRGLPLVGPGGDGGELVGGYGPHRVDRRPDPDVIPFLEK
ncbi:hypothetical protein GCM10020256_46550 [Streptomyces thermocoprophilus]